MKRLLFDTNIILDVLQRREPHFKTSGEMLNLIESGKYRGFLSATTITDVYYLIKKGNRRSVVIELMNDLLQLFEVAGVDRAIIFAALQSDMNDFEDAIQSETALINRIDFIITRNSKDFIKSKIPALTPNDFILKFEG